MPVAVDRPVVVDRFDLAQAEIDALRARAETAETRLAMALASGPLPTPAPTRTSCPHRHHSHAAPAHVHERVVRQVYAPIEVASGSMLSLFA